MREVQFVAVTLSAPADRPVDIRVEAGVVTEVAARLPARAADQVVDAASRWATPGCRTSMSTWVSGRSRG